MAGTQFDPEVVDAFVAEVAAAGAREAAQSRTDSEIDEITARVRGLLDAAGATS
jgi:HD-GYP domain-containing protein (c-di-GMP phosphodiesterase class II)